MLFRILIAVDDPRVHQRLSKLLTIPGVFVLPPDRGKVIWEQLESLDVDLVVVERSLVPDGFAPWIATLRNLPERPDVIILAGRENPRERAALLAAGALAVLLESLPDAALGEALVAMVERRREQEFRTRAPMPQVQSRLADFESQSHAMQAFVGVARRVVNADSSLLILGETGVGKERMARALHAEGPRSRGPFIPINCGALPESLLEAELFGHEQGAFTGATRSRRGYFEMADRGTIFLDEIGELPLHLQVKLLRVLEDRKIQRVGSEHAVPVDVRLMAATHRQLEEDVTAKRFRADLYYRLAVVTLTIPPLRERGEDIAGLVENYLHRFRHVGGGPPKRVSEQAMQALLGYAWPGNVRELINVIERAVLLCNGDTIDRVDLPTVIAGATPVASFATPVSDPQGFDQPLREARQQFVAGFERAYLTRLLETTNGRIAEAAERAGVDERSIYNLMRKHDLRKEAFRSPSKRSKRAAARRP